MRSYDEYKQILELWEQGVNKLQISKQLKLPRTTIRKCIEKFKTVEGLEAAPKYQDWQPSLDNPDYCEAYAYVLGIYLGDGYICKSGRSFRLRVKLDTKYPLIIERCQQNIQTILPDNLVSIVPNIDNCIEVSAHSNDLPVMFPQHGEGVKHLRKIALEDWQQQIVDQYPVEFLRGLYHSDGSYCEPVVNGKIYSRYYFTNISEDIMKLWCDTLEKLSIRWTRWGKNVAVSRRPDVALLDRLLGKKA